MKCPPGYDGKEGYVWKLNKSLYGLKQANRAWYEKVRKKFEELGFTRSEADHSVFFKVENGVLLVIAVYVDDMIALSRSRDLIQRIKLALGEAYELKDLGEVLWILNMEIQRDRGPRTLTISQQQYIKSILERHGMANCRPLSTPMEANLHLPKLANAEIDPKEYQSALGSLMYAMLGTRPDIAHSVGVLSQHAATPGKQHWNALMRVFHYLCGTADLKLTYRGSSEAKELVEYVDADHASDPVDRRSFTGYAFVLNGAAVTWASKKQHSVSTSSTDAEYVAGSEATKEAVWLRLLLSEIGQLKAGPTTLLIDNQSAIARAKNPVCHSRTKHVAVQHHFIREKVESGEVKAEYIPTGDQVADVLTKALAREKHEKFTKGLRLS